MSTSVDLSKIDAAKIANQCKTSEELFEIIQVPDYQCKEIDKIIKVIKLCYNLSNKIDRHDEEDLRTALNDINYELSGLDRDIEDIRSACEGIRDWGQSWKDLSKKLINEENINIELYI